MTHLKSLMVRVKTLNCPAHILKLTNEAEFVKPAEFEFEIIDINTRTLS